MVETRGEEEKIILARPGFRTSQSSPPRSGRPHPPALRPAAAPPGVRM